jgi:hypothetical protein
MTGDAERESQVTPQRKMCHAAAVLVLLSLSTIGSFGQTSFATTATPPQYTPGPITDYTAAQPSSSDVLRFRRGERYNIPDPSLLELGENSETAIWELPETHFQKNAMPFDASDAVVVGTVNAGQSYLSNDRRNIYSEFKLKLQEIIKTSNALYLRVADSIDIQRKGGAVRLPSGKVLTRGALADSMPHVGNRYLLFLKFNRDTDDFGVLTGYELEGTEVYRLDDLNFSESNHQKAIHPLRKEGVSEDQFLARAKSIFLSRKTGAS